MTLTSKTPKYSYIQTCFWATYPPQIPRGLTLNWNRASALRDWRLPSAAMERLPTFEYGHFSNRDVTAANGWTVRNSNFGVSARKFLFSTAMQSTPWTAQPPLLQLPGIKRSGHEFYYSPHLALRVSTGTAIAILLLCVPNGVLRSYLYSLTPEGMLKSPID